MDVLGGTWVYRWDLGISVGLGWDLRTLGGTWMTWVGLGCLLWDLGVLSGTWVTFVGLG